MDLANTTWVNTCHAKFHASVVRVQYFSVYFFGSNPGHPGEDPFKILGPLFEQTRLSTTRQCYIPNFKQLGLDKKIFQE